MSHVYEMMNINVVSVHPEDTLEKVVFVLTENSISGVPVVDNDYKVIGMISDRDLRSYSEKLNIVPLASFSTWVFPSSLTSDDHSYEKRVDVFSKTKVRDIMSKQVVSINDTNSWHQAVKLMKKHGINRIPVVDEEGKLKGIITRNDLLFSLDEHHIES